MFGLLLFGFFMMLVSIVFWYFEIKPYLGHKYRIQNYSSFPPFAIAQGLWSFLVNLFRFFYYAKYFALDMVITMASISILGFGNAVSGGILGLAFSNCVSGLLAFLMWKENRDKRKQLAAA